MRFPNHKAERQGRCLVWQGPLSSTGYGVVCENGDRQYAHRLAWKVANGRDVPAGHVVDHICHNRRCVDPAHLRVATIRQNVAHRAGANKNSSSGLRGISLDKRDGRWSAYVTVNRVRHALGRYATAEEAAKVAADARAEAFGEFAGGGSR